MKIKMTGMSLWISFVLLCSLNAVHSWSGGGKKVILRDVDVLTLYPGKMTEGRRSSPVQQLECSDKGSAPCSIFQPNVIQCYNRGSDGNDIQWECKTDMDNAYRFGTIDVSCEGYDYPEDDYILAGSCGLRYSVDYTKEGHQQQKQQYSSSYGWNTGQDTGYSSSKKGFFSGIADLIVWVAVGLMCFALYKSCVPQRNVGEDAYSRTDGDSPTGGGGGGGNGQGGGNGGYGWFGGNGGGTRRQNPTAPPQDDYDDASCHRNRRQNNAGMGGGGGGGGFWTGAATGGLLGYMFGNRGNQYGGGYNRGYGNYGGGFGSGRSFGGGGFGGGGGGFGGGSSGSRSASGFGGTSRR